MNKSNSHNTSQLIHAGVELVVGAGVTFWLNRKISSVSQKVSLLEDKLKFFESMLTQHHELIKKLFSNLETPSRTAKIDTPVPVTKTPSNPEVIKPDTLSEPLDHVQKEAKIAEMFSIVEPTPADLVTNTNTDGDSTAELDAILSVEIEDLKTNQNSSLR